MRITIFTSEDDFYIEVGEKAIDFIRLINISFDNNNLFTINNRTYIKPFCSYEYEGNTIPVIIYKDLSNEIKSILPEYLDKGLNDRFADFSSDHLYECLDTCGIISLLNDIPKLTEQLHPIIMSNIKNMIDEVASLMEFENKTFNKVDELQKCLIAELESYGYECDLEASGNFWELTYLIKELNIKNANGISHKIHDLYVRLKFDSYRLMGVSGLRGVLTASEYKSGYRHSHLPTFTNASFAHFCLGSGTPLSNSINSELNNPTDVFILVTNLNNYVQWESLDGGPYIRMSNISQYRTSTKIKRSILFKTVASLLYYIKENPTRFLQYNQGSLPNFIILADYLDQQLNYVAESKVLSLEGNVSCFNNQSDIKDFTATSKFKGLNIEVRIIPDNLQTIYDSIVCDPRLKEDVIRYLSSHLTEFYDEKYTEFTTIS